MNKFLKTTLITAVLSTGVCAATADKNTEGHTGALPNYIESGATIYVNKDIVIGDESIEHAFIDNYGSIDTQITSEPYPTISAPNTHQATINNHSGIIIEQENDQANKNSIKTSNPITAWGENEAENFEITDVYKITENSIGKINSNIDIADNVTIVPVVHRELSVEKDFIDPNTKETLAENDLLFLGKDGETSTITIRGGDTPETTKINCNLGSLGTDNAYNLKIKDGMTIHGDVSNYKGTITLNKETEQDKNPMLIFETGAKEINMPIVVETGILDFTTWGVKVNSDIVVKNDGQIFFNTDATKSPAEIKGDITISNEGRIQFAGKATLKSGATLTIGDVE